MRFLPKITIPIILLFLPFVSVVFAQMPNVTTQTTTVNGYVHFDIDYDGIPNWWELFYGLNPADPSDAPLDPDADELTNLQEYIHRTNPYDWDTDDGGRSDGEEVRMRKNPRYWKDDWWVRNVSDGPAAPKDIRGDSDGDGLSNEEELLRGTDPKNIDTDGDGLNDNEELYEYQTNPLEKDTDFDGLSDYDELKKYFTNPISKDTDFDGLQDADEIFAHKTNPSLWDTDDGGMSDFDEVNNGFNPLYKDDDYQFVWIVYYGEQPNDLFKSLENNKIDIYQGLNLTLEAIKPQEASKLTIQFNSKGFTTEKELVKLKVLSPDEPGLYQLLLNLELNNGKVIRMTRYVEVKRRGEIVRRASGQFNNVYSKFDFFNDQKASGAEVEVLVHSDLSNSLVRYTSDIFDIENPLIADANGSFVVPLQPGNYLIKIYKNGFGTKEILFETEKYTLFSENVYLTYNYDLIIWGIIFIIIFSFTWFGLQGLEVLRNTVRKSIETKAKAR